MFVASSTIEFSHLRKYGSELAALAQQAQSYASTDAGASLMKLRVFAELMAKNVGERHKVVRSDAETADDYLNRLEKNRLLPRKIANLFHEIRKAGNAAAHGEGATRERSQKALRQAHEISKWFDAEYGGGGLSAVRRPVIRPKPSGRFAPRGSSNENLSAAERLRFSTGANVSTDASKPFVFPTPVPSSGHYLVWIAVAILIVAGASVIALMLR